MEKTVVLNVVGLTRRLLGKYTPFINSFLAQGGSATVTPVVPAVTCTAQATYLTGKWPSEHGIVGNGWYFKDECEVKFWRQSNKLVTAEKLWEKLKRQDSAFTCANHFWWYNMYSTADYSVTPRPNYLADGRKIPDIYSHPAELRDQLQTALGTFPLFHFWGPKTSVKSSQWIADAALKTDGLYDPTLTLIYLPHLDYNLQKYGLNFEKIGKDLTEIDTIVEQLVSYYKKQGTRIIILSEYGITDVDHPIHLNRVLRSAGYLSVRTERGLELLDAGASKAFAVADHQVAHIYLNDSTLKEMIKQLLKNVKGVEEVWSREDTEYAHLDHDRCGDLVVIADRNSWFTYYYWESDEKAPDYARMVDIHKKPGYDPVELFTDPSDHFVMPKVIGMLIKKKLGFRTVMDIIPLKPELVKGSHGRIPGESLDYPILITNHPELLSSGIVEARSVFTIIENHLIK